MINRFKQGLLKTALAGSALTLAIGCSAQEGKQKANDNNVDKKTTPKTENKKSASVDDPNVVFIVLDDAGFSDLGSFGSEIETPNLDKLAENGIMYNNFHVSPLSSPTRASLLTGRNSHAVGMGTVANFYFGEEFTNRQGQVVPEAGTIAQVLSDYGYNTYHLGKWHLAPTYEATPAGPYHNWPIGKGYQRYYGFLEDSADQYKPELTEDNTPIEAPEDDDFHISESMVEKANQYVTDLVSVYPDKPFHINMSFGAPHMPHQAPKEFIDKYDGVYDDGWEKIREQRYARQVEEGIIPAGTKLAPTNPNVEDWDSYSKEEQRALSRLMETYAGFLTHTDEQIGKFIDHLEEIGELDNTIVFLFSDNGASAIGGNAGSTNHTLAYNFINQELDEIIDEIDNMGSSKAGTEYTAGWAQTSNTPFKFYKNSTYAGGTHAPLIVHWPNGTDKIDQIRNQYVHVQDITATVYDVLGLEPPESINGVEQMPISGLSFSESFTNPEAEAERDTQYYEVSGNRAIYHDGWKAISIHKKGEPFENDTWELYHVAEDFTEIVNLAEEEQEKLEELIEVFDEEAEKYNVYPISDLFIEAFSNIKEGTIRDNDEFTYYRGMSMLADSAAPPIIDRSYTIDIPINHQAEDEGVLLASGNHESGYTIYIQDGRVYYEYNNGRKYSKIESDSTLPEGDINIRFEFERTGDLEGIGKLYVNEEEVASEELTETLPYKISFEGLSIGEDAYYPVSKDYKESGNFPYSGTFEKVLYKLE